jgi:cysteine synthase
MDGAMGSGGSNTGISKMIKKKKKKVNKEHP